MIGTIKATYSPHWCRSDPWGWAFLIFRDIPNAPGYQVASDGTIWSNRGTDGIPSPTWKALSLYRRPYGNRYVVVCLRPEPGGKVRCLYVHRIVLEAFIGACPPGMESLHIDGNTANNNVRNLHWGTPLENSEDADRHGSRPRGSENRQAKLVEDEIPTIRKLYADGLSQHEIAELFGLTQSVIGQIVRGERWTHVSVGKLIVRSNVKLTASDVTEARRLAGEGIRYKDIADRFNVSVSAIEKAIRGITWREAPGEIPPLRGKNRN